MAAGVGAAIAQLGAAANGNKDNRSNRIGSPQGADSIREFEFWRRFKSRILLRKCYQSNTSADSGKEDPTKPSWRSSPAPSIASFLSSPASKHRDSISSRG